MSTNTYEANISEFAAYKRLNSRELATRLETLLTEPTADEATNALLPILQELHLHQIRLEIQNRELCESQHRLEQSRDRYISLFDYSPVGYLTLDRNGTILSINLRGATILGRDRARLIGTRFNSLVVGSDSHLLPEHLARVFKSSEKVTHELKLRLLGRSADPVPIRVESVTVASSDSTTVTCNTAIIELTEQKKIEADLRNERDRAQCYLDTVEAIIVALDATGHVTLINRKGCEILGSPSQSIVGAHWFTACIPPTSDSDNALIDFQMTMEGRRAGIEYHESLVLSRFGTEHLIAWHNSYLRDENGKLIGILSAGEDITERRRAERALNNQREILDLLANGANLHDVLTKLALAAEELGPYIYCSVLLLNDDGQTLRLGAAPSLPDFYNQAISGISTSVDAGCYGNATFRRVPTIVEDILSHPYWATYKNIAEKAGLRACWSVPILSTTGELLGIVANYHQEQHRPNEWELNSTRGTAYLAGIAIERWRAEQQAHQHRAELAHMARLNTMGEMATGMAHELNQPLTAIATYTDVALRMLDTTTPPYPKIREALQRSREQAQRASELIRHLRKLVRKQRPQRKDVDINALVHEVIRFIHYDANRRNQQFFLQLEPTLPRVYADYIQLEQVLLNLIRSSIDRISSAAAERREVSLLTFVNSEGLIQITVADTFPDLPWISKNKSETIVSSNEGVTRMDMSLSICHSIIAAHGGYLLPESRLGSGRAFHVFLPPAPPLTAT